jgi:glutamate/tyrosine decarboxylase-like PLP-dependent enzyme
VSTPVPALSLPAQGRPKEAVLAQMRAARDHDVRWRQGRAFSLVFHAGDDVSAVLQEAYTLFFAENGLNPTAFPSLRRFETEVVAMTAGLLGGGAQTVGNMTSGGTESLLLAVKTARDWGRATRGITAPEMVLPATAHPAFDKAAHYFGVRAVRVPVGADFRADVDAVRGAVTANTVLIVGSAPQYPHGVVDPIEGLAAVAAARDMLMHVDACVGGLMLPFVRRLGYPVPPFDLSVPGVTSISADLHKYGYAAKGASVLLYRDNAVRRHQLFAAMDWPGGIYASPAIAGTRPGGAIAAAWAVLNYLGEAGYLRLNGTVMEAVARLKAGIRAIPGLRVLGEPEMSVMALAGDGLDIYEVGDELTARGWYLDRQQFPPSLHLTVHHGHAAVVDEFLADLAAAAEAVRRPGLRKAVNWLAVSAANALTRWLPEAWVSGLTRRLSGALGGGGGLPGRSAAMYGMMGSLPNRGDLRELVLDLVEGFTRPQT